MATPQDKLKSPVNQLPPEFYSDSPYSWEQGTDTGNPTTRAENEQDVMDLNALAYNKKINSNVLDLGNKILSPATIITDDILGMDTDGLLSNIASFIGPGEAASLGKMFVVGAVGDDFLRALLRKLRGEKPKLKPKSNFNPSPRNPNAPSLNKPIPTTEEIPPVIVGTTDKVPPLRTMDDYYMDKYAGKIDELTANTKRRADSIAVAKSKQMMDINNAYTDEMNLNQLRPFVRKPKQP